LDRSRDADGSHLQRKSPLREINSDLDVTAAMQATDALRANTEKDLMASVRCL
jgi:hypothetical protein